MTLSCLAFVASALLLAARQLSPAALAFSYAGLCLNAYFLGTALAQPALERYASPMQGVAAALVVTGAWLAARTVRRVGPRAA